MPGPWGAAVVDLPRGDGIGVGVVDGVVRGQGRVVGAPVVGVVVRTWILMRALVDQGAYPVEIVLLVPGWAHVDVRVSPYEGESASYIAAVVAVVVLTLHRVTVVQPGPERGETVPHLQHGAGRGGVEVVLQGLPDYGRLRRGTRCGGMPGVGVHEGVVAHLAGRVIDPDPRGADVGEHRDDLRGRAVLSVRCRGRGGLPLDHWRGLVR